jgi:hypothetical protein
MPRKAGGRRNILHPLPLKEISPLLPSALVPVSSDNAVSSITKVECIRGYLKKNIGIA